MKSIAYSFLLLLTNISLLSGQCDISNIELTPIACDSDNTFSLEVNLTVVDPTGEQFLLLANGASLGTYDYSALPVLLDGFMGDCSTSYQFVIRDAANPGCSNTATLAPVCCGIPCAISVINETPKTCNMDGTLDFPLDIEYQGILNPTTFTVLSSTTFSATFEYADLPVTVENFPVGSTPIIEYIICDDGSCCDTFSFINPCVCSILNTSGTILDCSDTDSTYFVEVDFDRGMSSDSFLMGFDVMLLGTFAYADLPVTVGPFPFSDNDLEFLVVDQERSLCFNSVEVGVVDDCIFNCEISSLVTKVVNCSSGTYDIDFSFDVSQILAGTSFEVFLDGISLATLPIEPGGYALSDVALDCDRSFQFGIEIVGTEGCEASAVLDSIPCCECSIADLNAMVVCDPSAALTFDFTTTNVSDSFRLIVGSDTLGPFLYQGNAGTFDASTLPNGTYELHIVDAEDATCTATTTFELDCMDESCQLLDFSYEYRSCEGQSIYIDAALAFAGITSDSFIVMVNDSIVGLYAYADSSIAIGPLLLDCELDYPIVFQDSEDSTCLVEGLLMDVPCCDAPCMWTQAEAVSTCISTDSVQVEIFAEANQADSALFSVSYGSESIGTYSYGQLPLAVSFPYTDLRVLTLMDLIDTSCIVDVALDFDCDVACMIGELDFEIDRCENGFFDILLDFESSDTQDSFTISGNGLTYGTYSYADLPILLESLEADTGIDYVFTVDNIGTVCSGEVAVGSVMCEPNATNTIAAELIFVTQWSEEISINMPWPTAQLSIYSVDGQLVKQQKINNRQRVATGRFPAGLYLLAVAKGEVLVTKKLLIVK